MIYRILASILIIAALSFGSFYAGYRVSAWHKDSTQLSLERQQQADAVTAQQRMDKQNAIVIAKIDAANQRTSDLQAATQSLIEGQDNALNIIQFKIGHLPVGHCSFTPAAGRLWDETYHATFGALPGGHQAAGTSQAAH